ncbi:LONGIFOLIA1, TON1 Recruiting Motif 2 [Hibiscus trionum]|uniref:LONGIFOLIA1, TON1 Recruiting Motif 2 n=1 Tax=Hibiscus trionum TaxID=183268 RepID=A0A9W7GYF5_HIBTR|nr:LONGIFOLIA1, TON1 Recruiting Motif 2 [Hibiscus trionum]
MSSKFMYSLLDENPDLHKQTGCMNGLFQLFDCHHFYGSRRIARPDHKRLPSGPNGKHRTEAKIGSDKKKGNNPKKKQRFSFESPRISLSSSSCSSSFSPAHCSKESHVDRSSSRTAFRETLRKEIFSYQSNASLQSSQNSLHLRNVVKDSIYREARGLSIKTATKVEAGQHQTFKYVGSPRPLQSLKPSTTRNTGRNEPSHGVVKLKGAPKMSNKCEDGSLSFAPMDARRFSYDGRGSQYAHKSKPKDFPRLSLDSSMKSNFLLGELNRSSMNTNDIRSQQQEAGSYVGSSCVVAKLMGLKVDPLSPSSRFGCSGNSRKELTSPRVINAEAKKLVYGEIEKKLAELEFMTPEKDLGALKQILEAMQKSKQISGTRKEEQTSSFISHTSSILGQSSEVPNLRKLHSSNAISVTIKGTTTPTCLKLPINSNAVTENGSNSASSVVATSSLSRLPISSHANTRYEKADKQSYKDLTPRGPSSQLHSRDNTARTLKVNQISKGHSLTARENPKMAVSLETTCLKLHQKKLEKEKQSRHTDPGSDQSRSRRQASSIQANSGLPHRKPGHKSHNMWQSDDQLSDISSDMRDLSHQGDDSSMQSESNMSTASYGDNEVSSAQSYDKIEGTFSRKQEMYQKNPAARLVEGGPKAEPPRTALEQPSPVSVLDATFYGDESPSPVKKKSKAFEGDEDLIPSNADWSSIGLNHLPTCRETSPKLKTDGRKSENIQQLVQRFMSLDSVHEIKHICKSPNPDHEYIAEVMLASGLLNQLEFSFAAYQLHPSGHLLNPNLFPALEQIKTSIWFLNTKQSGRKVNQMDPIQKSHRQVIFDAVNEILITKSVKKGSYKQWTFPSTREDRRRKTQQLVRDLCSEIDKLETSSNIEDNNLNSIIWGDLAIGSMDWTDCQSEIPWLVLDVERLIFKDLICEVANLQQRRRSHCRQLFPSMISNNVL